MSFYNFGMGRFSKPKKIVEDKAFEDNSNNDIATS